jgi:peptidoglycan/xylan/chitin deacetylase (PgdA/CDA1 family)
LRPKDVGTVKRTLIIFLLTAVHAAMAAGPESVGTADRSLWPQAISSPAAFDRASRAEMLVFAATLSETSRQAPEAMEAAFRIKKVNPASVQKVTNDLAARILANWAKASKSCGKGELFCPTARDFEDLASAGRAMAAGLPPEYRNWHANAQQFHQKYVNELLRLAALFPAVTSEIDVFSSLERTGFELPDKQFLLTFDDGPTDKGGTTDKLLEILKSNGLHASFYMLGERLQARIKQSDTTSLAASYQGQCVAMHGWKHDSHAKIEAWQQSVLDTRDLVKATFPRQYTPWFRPPYGQRKPDSGDFFRKNDLGVALWNIDSQDWNSHVDGMAAAQRVYTLLLLWRHGVVLFHDVHDKALTAVPWLLEHGKGAGITWQDCATYH